MIVQLLINQEKACDLKFRGSAVISNLNLRFQNSKPKTDSLVEIDLIRKKTNTAQWSRLQMHFQDVNKEKEAQKNRFR